MTSTIENLERLASLRDRGILTEGEFRAEKGRVLAESRETSQRDAEPALLVAEASSPPNQVQKSRPVPDDTTSRRAQTAKTKRLWESFERIDTREDAGKLLKAGWWSASLIVGAYAIHFLASLWTAASGNLIDPLTTNGDALLLHLLLILVISTIYAALAWGASSRRNRYAAGTLIALGMIELVSSLSLRLEGDRTLGLASVLFCMTAVFLGIQCFRAILAWRRFENETL